jgi:hypothetical protein
MSGNGVDNEGSTNIHELPLKPISILLLKGVEDTGLVGLLENPKFMKLFASPLP